MNFAQRMLIVRLDSQHVGTRWEGGKTFTIYTQRQ